MTTPTWEPVGQEDLRLLIAWPDAPDAPGPLVERLAAELLAARALLVALVEAEDRCAAATVGEYASGALIAPNEARREALDAIRAHVQRIRSAETGAE